ncbi:MAG TPA: hypothetical protein VN426_07650 [Syntrophomonadaceae bacterium]|nr:hypothetical protein [Syntrophomonadaceae bacterium]
MVKTFGGSELLAMIVVSYNIHHGLDMSGENSLHRIQTLLQQLGPDVLFLQEVDRIEWKAV